MDREVQVHIQKVICTKIEGISTLKRYRHIDRKVKVIDRRYNNMDREVQEHRQKGIGTKIEVISTLER